MVIVVEKIGKIVVSVEDFLVFIVNCILILMINEVVYMFYEGVGLVKFIDELMKLGVNYLMGSLELVDFIGLDICFVIMNVLYDGLVDMKYCFCLFLVKYVEVGWLGCKIGCGFYDYLGEVFVFMC